MQRQGAHPITLVLSLLPPRKQNGAPMYVAFRDLTRTVCTFRYADLAILVRAFRNRANMRSKVRYDARIVRLAPLYNVCVSF